MKRLLIRWQRLVNGAGLTCDRCGDTGQAVEEAAAILRSSLGNLGIEVVLETEVLSESEFLEDTLESNRIWIAGRLFRPN
jgi:hypothetical protein